MYWKKANSWGAVAAFVGGFAVWIAASLYFFQIGIGGQSTAAVCEYTAEMGIYSDAWWCGFWDAIYIGSFVAFIAGLFLMIIVSLLSQKISPPRKLVDYYGEPMDLNWKLNLGLLPIKDAFRKITEEEKETT
jgi:Na+/proline symporter